MTLWFIISAGFAHKDNNPQSIDLNCLRLCFQVFLEGNEKGAFTFALKPVVSDPIFDKSKFVIFKNRLFWSRFGVFFMKSMQDTDRNYNGNGNCEA